MYYFIVLLEVALIHRQESDSKWKFLGRGNILFSLRKRSFYYGWWQGKK